MISVDLTKTTLFDSNGNIGILDKVDTSTVGSYQPAQTGAAAVTSNAAGTRRVHLQSGHTYAHGYSSRSGDTECVPEAGRRRDFDCHRRSLRDRHGPVAHHPAAILRFKLADVNRQWRRLARRCGLEYGLDETPGSPGSAAAWRAIAVDCKPVDTDGPEALPVIN